MDELLKGMGGGQAQPGQGQPGQGDGIGDLLEARQRGAQHVGAPVGDGLSRSLDEDEFLDVRREAPLRQQVAVPK